jgi:hypothetical protein
MGLLMTVYALDLDQVHQTIRDTLVNQVLPGVQSGTARSELLAVVEMLDSLGPRLAWESGSLSAVTSRTHALAAVLDRGADAAEGGAADSTVDALRAERQSIGDALSAVYADGFDPAIVEAVAEFTAEDVRTQISPALRPGLPG